MRRALCQMHVFSVLVWLVAAPVVQAGNGRPVLETFSQGQCAWQSEGASIRVFQDAAQWLSLFPATLASPFKLAPDWRKQVVISATLGTRPSSGYSLELRGKAFVQKRGALQMDFDERRPAADSFQQEVVTQPCVFILTTRGTWRSVLLRNAETGARLEAATAGPNVKANRQRLR